MHFDKEATSLFVFDLETIPDVSVVGQLCDRHFTSSTHALHYYNYLHYADDTDLTNVQADRKALTDYHLEITGGKNAFHRQLFHQIVSISFVVANVELGNDGERYKLQAIRSGGEILSSEEEIIRGCVNYLSKKRHRLITFNGRTFDVPVLKYRALKYGIPIPWLYKGETDRRFPNYNYRYNTEWNCDLLDVLSDFSASASIKLKEVCSLLNIPCKYDVDGSSVSELYDQGKIKEIRDYCEIDALVTYIVYLRYALLSGRTSQTSYHVAIKDIVSYIETNQRDKPHLLYFLTLWREINQHRHDLFPRDEL